MDIRPLVTLGDAIASFLDAPNQTIKGFCLASKDDFLRNAPKLLSPRGDVRLALPLQYRPQRRFWFSAASRGRWLTNIILSSATLITVITLFAMEAGLPDPSPSSFGVPNPANVIMFADAANNGYQAGLVSSVLVANSPQLLLSFIYFAYNSLFTCILLAHEWSG